VTYLCYKYFLYDFSIRVTALLEYLELAFLHVVAIRTKVTGFQLDSFTPLQYGFMLSDLTRHQFSDWSSKWFVCNRGRYHELQ